MKDRERLEELINRKPSRWGNLTIKEFERDIKILQKQAEEKQAMQREYSEDIDFKRKQVLDLQEEGKRQRIQYLKLCDHVDRLEQQNKRYEEALQFYADPNNYQFGNGEAEADAGEVARQALQNNREG